MVPHQPDGHNQAKLTFTISTVGLVDVNTRTIKGSAANANRTCRTRAGNYKHLRQDSNLQPSG